MKRIIPYITFLILIIGVVFIYFSCSEDELPPLFEPDTTQEIIPLDSSGSGTTFPDVYPELQTEEVTPKVPVSANETLLRVLNVNLDLDRLEEQILVLKDKDSVDSYISIAVVDYDNVIKDYKRTWQGKTLSANIRGFSVTMSDLIGDHNMEIICSGISLDGLQSLTVFRKTKGDNGVGLFYSEIFNLQAKGAIEILETDRAKSYESGLRDGQSFPIISTIQDPESDNILDNIKNTYYWDFPSRRYIKVNEQKLLGRELEEEQLREIYRSSYETFVEHISGPWMMNDGSGTIIDFNLRKKRITFFSKELQEVFIWTNTYKILNNLIQISGRNELINHVENVINVKLIDLNTLQISVRDIDTQTRIKTPNDIWSGRYFFLSSEIRNGSKQMPETGQLPFLYGTYSGDTGEQIFFDQTSFSYKSEEEEFRGGYSIYKSDVDIFSMRIFDENGIPVKNRIFKYEFTEETLDNSIQRTLTLYEGRHLIFGFEPFSLPRLRFQQIELIEDSVE
ncbi:MAG: pallilysin-related adhesin [Spirochaetales bacterium]|nr:pallilysin-related adhesin [Spirochaetales bacterium]